MHLKNERNLKTLAWELRLQRACERRLVIMLNPLCVEGKYRLSTGLALCFRPEVRVFTILKLSQSTVKVIR